MKSSPGGQPEFLEHRSCRVELRDTVGEEPSKYGYPRPVFSNESDVSGAYLFGGAVRDVEQVKGLLEASTVCLKDPEVVCCLAADIGRESPSFNSRS